MRFFICGLVFFGCLLRAENLESQQEYLSEEMFELINLYQNEGVLRLEERLQDYLLTPAYWLRVVSKKDIRYGYYQHTKYLFVSDKALPDLRLLKITQEGFEMLGSSSALVAKGKGHKKLEGDLTTPIGVYDLNARLTRLPAYYGPLAFATNYPNTYDRSLKKTGSGIWIHGLPLDGNREEINTRGCIAIDNTILNEYDKIIHFKDTAVIISEGRFQEMTHTQAADLLSGLFSWKEAWRKGDLQTYLSFYDENDFIRENGMRYKAFAEYKKRIFAKNESKQIKLSAIDVFPFPNEQNKTMFRLSFHQEYKASLDGVQSFASSHRKDLYVWLDGGKMKILSEK